jgi:DDB1- and CUL4-associated factor 1
LEEETVNYYRKDPDPFDERHPSRTDPECELGRMLKSLFRKDHFMTRLVNDYLRDNFFTRQNVQQSSKNLNIAACRLILIIMPGLETSAVFQLEFDNQITRLYTWAEKEDEPLRSYATGLLGAAMEVNEIASSFRDSNIRLLPIMLRRLHELQHAYKNRSLYFEALKTTNEAGRSSKAASPAHLPVDEAEGAVGGEAMDCDDHSSLANKDRPFAHLGGGSEPNSPEAKRSKGVLSPKLNGGFKNTTDLSALFANESNASTQDRSYVRNIIPIYPPTMATSQMLILRYLTPMGEYQEFLPYVFEYKAMDLILQYIDKLDPKETCLAFEALKYLASLLCHKKFSLEFIANGGLNVSPNYPSPWKLLKL